MTPQERAREIVRLHVAEANNEYGFVVDLEYVEALIVKAQEEAVEDALRVPNLVGVEMTEEHVADAKLLQSQLAKAQNHKGLVVFALRFNAVIDRFLAERQALLGIISDLATDFPDRTAERAHHWQQGAEWMREKAKEALHVMDDGLEHTRDEMDQWICETIDAVLVPSSIQRITLEEENLQLRKELAALEEKHRFDHFPG
jgi:hypothetical protein